MHCAEPARPKAAAEEVGECLDAVWALAAEPLLFSLAGAAVCLPAMAQQDVVKCLVAALIGMSAGSLILVHHPLDSWRMGWLQHPCQLSIQPFACKRRNVWMIGGMLKTGASTCRHLRDGDSLIPQPGWDQR